VLLVSELHAAAALAQAVGRTLSYDKTALMFVDSDTAILAVIESVDGSVAKILSQNPYSAGAIATLTEMVPSLEAEEPQPQGMFVVGSDVDVTSVRAHLTNVLTLPVIASEEPQLALARGAALASANTPRFDTSTVGLAYSLDSGETVVHSMAYGTTAMLPHDDPSTGADVDSDSDDAPERSKTFVLAGSTLALFAAGVTALAIAMAVSIQPAVGQGPGEITTRPSELAPPPTIASAQPAQPKQVPTPPSAAIETARLMVPPAPPPRRVLVGDAAPAPAAPPPPAPAPAAPPPAPIVQLPLPGLPPIVVQFSPPLLQGPPQFKGPKNAPWDVGGKKQGKGRGKGH
jgi:hypothetical protein